TNSLAQLFEQLVAIENEFQHQLAQLDLNPINHVQAIHSLLTQPGLMSSLLAQSSSSTGNFSNENGTFFRDANTAQASKGGIITGPLNALLATGTLFSRPFANVLQSLIPINKLLTHVYGVDLNGIGSLISNNYGSGFGSGIGGAGQGVGDGIEQGVDGIGSGVSGLGHEIG